MQKHCEKKTEHVCHTELNFQANSGTQEDVLFYFSHKKKNENNCQNSNRWAKKQEKTSSFKKKHPSIL